jgi:hypothetical protein
MTDNIEHHISATPKLCEQVAASLKVHNGSTVTSLSYYSGLSRILVIDALEQMESRGCARHDGPNWYLLVTS